MREIELIASAAYTETAGTNGSAYPLYENERLALALLTFTAKATDSGDLCDVYLDVSPDGGTTWLNAVHFTQALGNGTDAETQVVAFEPVSSGTAPVAVTADASAGAVRAYLRGNQIRGRYVIVASGTDNESFTFSLKAYTERD